jgi:titin
VAGLSVGVSHVFAVRAHSAAGLGGESDMLTLIERTAPNSPRLEAVWTDDRVDLSWSSPYNGGSSITGYELFKQWPGLSNWTLVASLTGNEYSDTTVLNGQTYAYKVRAVNAIGEGKMSNVVKDFPRTIPSAPELYVLNPGSNSLFAMWAEPDDDGGAPVQGYSVYVDGVLYANTSALNVTIQDLQYGISYSVTVLAYNLAGSGPSSEPMSAVPVSVPGPIGGLEAEVEPNLIVIDWEAPSQSGGAGQVQYRVYQRLQGASEFSLLTTTASTSYEASMTLADIGKARDFKVEAFNAIGTGGNMSLLGVVPNVVYLSGTVLDENGGPIEGATVSTDQGGQATTKANGSYIIQVQPGTVVLNITATGHDPMLKEVVVGETPVEVETLTLATTQSEEEEGGIDLIWVLVPVLLIAGGGAAILLLRRKR